MKYVFFIMLVLFLGCSRKMDRSKVPDKLTQKTSEVKVQYKSHEKLVSFVAANKKYLSPPYGDFNQRELARYYFDLLIREQASFESFNDEATELGIAESKDDFYKKLTLACFEMDCPLATKSFLLKSISALEQIGDKLLFYSVYFANYEMIKYLIEKGIDPIQKKSFYSPYLIGLYLNDWESLKLMMKAGDNIFSVLVEEQIFPWINEIVPRQVSEKLNHLSKKNLRVYDKFAYVGEKKLSVEQNNKISNYLTLGNALYSLENYYEQLSENEYPMLLAFTRPEEGIGSKLGRSYYFYSRPSWEKKPYRTITVNLYDLKREMLETGKEPQDLHHQFLLKYFKPNNPKMRFAYNESRNIYDDSGVGVVDVSGHWLKVQFKDDTYGWIHSSQVDQFIINDVLHYTSLISLEADNRYNCKKGIRITVHDGEISKSNLNINAYEYNEHTDEGTVSTELAPGYYSLKKGIVSIVPSDDLCKVFKFELKYRDTQNRKGRDTVYVGHQ